MDPIPTPKCSVVRGMLVFFFGIVGPVLFLRLEYKTHCLSGCLFDPMPTRWHLMMLLVAPLTHLLALVGARWRAAWFQGMVQFLWWPSLIIPAYYAIALGPLVQGFALLFYPLFIVSWGMQGFAWPSSGPEMLEAQGVVTATLIILPMLAVVAWCCLLPWVIRCASGISRARLRQLWVSGALAVVFALCLVEVPMVRTFGALKAYAKGQTNGTVPPLLLENSRVALVSRLFHTPHQFSSDGVFDCEGPVDVFGPTVRVINGWESSTEMWNRFTMRHHNKWGELLGQIRTANPTANISPRSWRRLSSWERWEIKHGKSHGHFETEK